MGSEQIVLNPIAAAGALGLVAVREMSLIFSSVRKSDPANANKRIDIIGAFQNVRQIPSAGIIKNSSAVMARWQWGVVSLHVLCICVSTGHPLAALRTQFIGGSSRTLVGFKSYYRTKLLATVSAYIRRLSGAKMVVKAVPC